MSKKRWGIASFGSKTAMAAVVVLALSACDPIPRRTLSAEEKIADLEWVFSEFGANYAPLEYKASRYGFNFDDLKNRYREEARRTENNEQFYLLLQRFVAEFKDAHTKGSLTTSDLPARARVAYLGFSGERHGDALYVKELLPTTQSSSHYPIHVGDKIMKIDGKDLATAVKDELVQYRDLGNDEANLTFHFNKLFTRVSTTLPIPAAENAVLTVKNAMGEEREERLPWIVKDLSTFESEQSRARPAAAGSGEGSQVTRLGFLGFDGRMVSPTELFERVRRGSKDFSFWNTFQFTDNSAAWTMDYEVDAKTGALLPRDRSFTAVDRLRTARSVPEDAIFIEAARTYPAYVSRENVVDESGAAVSGQTRLVGTIWVDTFSPAGVTPDGIAEQAKATLSAFKTLGVRDIVIDLINNGGGSVEVGLKLAQALSPRRLTMPLIQFRLNDHWMDDLQADTISGASDTERELSRRTFVAVQSDFEAGQRLSRPFSMELFAPFTLTPNSEAEEGLNIVILVNEMCASMCDIFAGMLKDNAMARVVGAKTMGAGGNVVGQNSSAPNSHFQLNQTESLIVRSSGGYVENNGIDPDVAVAVSPDKAHKYANVRQKALQALLAPAPALAPAAPPATVAVNETP